MKKKTGVGIGIALIVLLAAGLITNYADSARVTTGQEPKYCIKTVSEDGNKVTYWGLGYKVIRYVNSTPDEPYENHIGVKMGSWFMNYEMPKDHIANKTEDTGINSIDEFYQTQLTQDRDIRSLSEEYGLFDAQKDGSLVIDTEVSANDLYREFMENCQRKSTSFVRVAQTTIEGDLILFDILYYEKTDQFYLVTDATRDRFSTDADRKIELKQFDGITEYEDENNLYWVLYRGEINDIDFTSEDVFLIAVLH